MDSLSPPDLCSCLTYQAWLPNKLGNYILKQSSSLSLKHSVLIQIHHIGGSPQIPELQVGQLVSVDLVTLEPELKKEEKSFVGFGAWHLGQLKLEPPSPRAWRTSNFCPHLVHWYS